MKDYTYVIGGHTVSQPEKFINSIERCHKSVPSSYFERVNISHSHEIGVDLNIQTLLSVPIKEDNGILIIGSSNYDNWDNQGFFIDMKDNTMK